MLRPQFFYIGKEVPMVVHLLKDWKCKKYVQQLAVSLRPLSINFNSIWCHLPMSDLLLCHIEKHANMVTFKWTLSKWPHWLNILPLCCSPLTLTIPTASSEPLPTQPMIALLSCCRVFSMHCQLHMTSSQLCSHRMKMHYCNWHFWSSQSQIMIGT